MELGLLGYQKGIYLEAKLCSTFIAFIISIAFSRVDSGEFVAIGAVNPKHNSNKYASKEILWTRPHVPSPLLVR